MRDYAALAVVPAVLFAAHSLYGADQRAASAALVLAEAVLLLGALCLPAWRRALANSRLLRAVAGLFGLTLLAAFWSLFSTAPGGVLPVWNWVGTEGAGVIDRSAALLEMLKLLGLGCIFLVGFMQGAAAERLRGAITMVLTFGAIFALISLLRFLAGLDISSGARLSTGLFNPNTAATLFGTLLVLSVAWSFNEHRRAVRQGRQTLPELTSVLAPSAGAALLFSGCLLLTASRAGVSATAGVLSLLLIAEALARRWGWRVLAPMIVAPAALSSALLVGSGAQFLERLQTELIAADGRSEIFRSHGRLFTASPWFGWGLGSFDQLNQQVITPNTYDALWRSRALHNVYLQWLEQAGLVGAAPMFLTIALVLGVGFASQFQRRQLGSLTRGLLAASAIVLAHALTDFAVEVPSFAGYWAFLLGLLLAASGLKAGRL